MKYTVSVKLRKDFLRVTGNTITIGVMARPEKGRANEEIIQKLAAYFHIPRSCIRIVSGVRSKNKIVEIS